MSPIIYSSFLLPSTRQRRVEGRRLLGNVIYTGLTPCARLCRPFKAWLRVCSYFERDLRCFWKNNVKTLRFQKLCLYQWCHIQWEVDYAVIYFYVVCRQDYASVNIHSIGSYGIVLWCMSLFLPFFLWCKVIYYSEGLLTMPMESFLSEETKGRLTEKFGIIANSFDHNVLTTLALASDEGYVTSTRLRCSLNLHKSEISDMLN